LEDPAFSLAIRLVKIRPLPAFLPSSSSSASCSSCSSLSYIFFPFSEETQNLPSMCPIDFDIDGDATVVDLVPQNGKVLEFAHGQDDNNALENFDFDSFLRCAAKDLPNFDSFQTLNFDCPLPATTESNDSYGLINTGASVPIAIPNAIACFPQFQLKTMPVEIENLQQLCIVLGQNYLQKIATIHNTCKKIAGMNYPDVLQNQLLTASRTLTKLADMIVKHHETILQAGVLGALEGVVLECQYALNRLNQDHGMYSRGNTIVIRSFQMHIKNSEAIVYESLVPLSKILRAFTWFVYKQPLI
jgi:hypothetical protein